MKTKDGLKMLRKPVTAFQPKRFPNTQKCGYCGSTMVFVDVELGYSCINKNCPLSLDHEEQPAEGAIALKS